MNGYAIAPKQKKRRANEESLSKTDYCKLKGKIREVCGTYSNFAAELGCSLNTLSAKLRHKSEFTQTEIIRSTIILGIPMEEVYLYFFMMEVRQE